MIQAETTKRNGKPGWPGRLNFNIVVAAFFILFSILFLAIIPYQIEKPLIILGHVQAGLIPTLFPRVTAILLLLVSVWYLISAFSLKETNFLKEIDKSGLVNIAVTVVALLMYALTMESLGFVISSAILVVILTSFYGNRNISIAVLSSIVVPIGIYYLFTKLLLVFLPENPFIESGFF